ncbi:hypothetical protein GYA49_05655 [Candidatus Beckwithbacteria bacterium]|nr:hypothetical protein [Candidatus Beckwithbacteria bacterium]
MKLPKVVQFFFKNILLFILGGIAIGRLFFPSQLEDMVINPARRMPVFGQVLGTTWDKAGSLGPAITQTTIDFANQVEQADLPISETITDLAKSDDPSQAASDAVEKKVNEKLQDVKDLPAEKVEEIKKELRKEMYQQICKDWLEED